MISSDRLLPFLGTVILLFLAPGPSVVFVVGRSLTLGARAGLIAVAGNTCGLATQLVVLLGSGLDADHTLLRVLKILGAGVLVLLGLTTIRHRRRDATGLGRDETAASDGERSRARGAPSPSPSQSASAKASASASGSPSQSASASILLRQGWIVGITNPKGLIIDTSIAPDVIHGHGDATLSLALLGACGVLAALLCDGAWALLSGTLARLLGSSPRRLERLNAAGGLLMVLFGIVLAVIAIS